MQATVLSNAGHALLQNFEAPRLDRELVHEDDIQHNPADGEQAVGRAIYRRRSRHSGRHVEAENRNPQGGRQSQQRGIVGLHVTEGQAAQQHHHRQRSDKG